MLLKFQCLLKINVILQRDLTKYNYIIWEEIQGIHKMAAHKGVTPYKKFIDTTRTWHKNDFQTKIAM